MGSGRQNQVSESVIWIAIKGFFRKQRILLADESEGCDLGRKPTEKPTGGAAGANSTLNRDQRPYVRGKVNERRKFLPTPGPLGAIHKRNAPQKKTRKCPSR